MNPYDHIKDLDLDSHLENKTNSSQLVNTNMYPANSTLNNRPLTTATIQTMP